MEGEWVQSFKDRLDPVTSGGVFIPQSSLSRLCCLALIDTGFVEVTAFLLSSCQPNAIWEEGSSERAAVLLFSCHMCGFMMRDPLFGST